MDVYNVQSLRLASKFKNLFIFTGIFRVQTITADRRVCCCLMITLVCRSMADSAVGRSFRLVVDRVNAAARSRPAVCLFCEYMYV